MGNGNTLEIEAGVVARFRDGTRLQLGWQEGDECAINAVGGANNLITFTSDAEFPSAGDWACIYLLGAASAHMEYCKVEYAGQYFGQYLRGGIVAIGATNYLANADVFDCEITACEGWAICWDGGTVETVDIERCNIHDNDNGIRAYSSIYYGQIEIMNNTIAANGEGIEMHGYDGSCYIYNNLLLENDTGISSGSFQGNDIRIYNNVIDQCEVGITINQIGEAPFHLNDIVTYCGVGITASYATATVDYLCFYENDLDFDENVEAGPHCLFPEEPQFASPTDYHLLYSSVCINSGDPEIAYPYDPDDGSQVDMGIYGGQYAWEPYYVLIPSTATDFNMTLQWSTYKVEGIIDVGNGENLRIEENAKLQFLAGLSLQVHSSGQIHTLGDEDSPITMQSWPAQNYWNGITIAPDANATSNLQYLNISHCRRGIECDNITLENSIEYCYFEDCSYGDEPYGIFLNSSNTDIQNCEFNLCDISIGMLHSNSRISYNLIGTGNNCGIDVGGGNSFIIEFNTLDHYVEDNIGIRVQYGAGLLDSNLIQNVDRGIILISSSPKLEGNHIDNCGEYGLFLSDGSQPVMRYDSPVRNRIANSADEEIHIQGHLYPLIRDGGNDLYDEEGGTIIQSVFDYNAQYLYDVRGNYWIYTDPAVVRQHILPEDSPPDYIIYVTSVSSSPFTDSFEPDAEDSLMEAVALEMSGQYEAAYGAYQEVISAYPNHPVAISAMTRMYYCAQALGYSLTNLYNYYLQLPQIMTDPKNLFYLQKAEAHALCGGGSYQQALTMLNGMLITVSNLTDSVFVLMDIANVQYEMSLNGNGLNGLGENAWTNYNLRMKELQEWLENFPSSRLGSSIPQSSDLRIDNISPNPFNSITVVSFWLPRSMPIDITIFNASGSRVMSLLSGWQHEGSHQLVFNASNLASGMYVCNLRGENLGTSTKLVLLK